MYVVHFTQAAAVAHAESLLKQGYDKIHQRGRDDERSLERLAGVRFGAGFGKTLSKLLRRGIGVHHAGMLPRYRRLVEQLAQEGLLTVICGTDTLGVGINVPIRTVLFTGLAKYDGHKQRVLRTREFLQIAGRAGRPGFDTVGVRRRTGARARHREREGQGEGGREERRAARAQRRSGSPRPQLTKPPEGTVVWTEKTFDKLVAGEPGAAAVADAGRQRDAGQRRRPRGGRVRGDAPAADRQPRGPAYAAARTSRRALRLARSLVHNGVLKRLDEPDEFGRRYVLTVELPEDFALNQPLALLRASRRWTCSTRRRRRTPSTSCR